MKISNAFFLASDLRCKNQSIIPSIENIVTLTNHIHFPRLLSMHLFKKGTITQDFHTISDENELYNYVRLEDINRLNELAQNKRVKIIAADGPSDYMRRELNAMDEETFEIVLELGRGFFGRKRSENISFLQRGLMQLEERQKRKREKDAKERKVWIPVSMLGGIMLLIILV